MSEIFILCLRVWLITSTIFAVISLRPELMLKWEQIRKPMYQYAIGLSVFVGWGIIYYTAAHSALSIFPDNWEPQRNSFSAILSGSATLWTLLHIDGNYKLKLKYWNEQNRTD